jgi:UDP-2,3-diacylglucosamine hydrolase
VSTLFVSDLHLDAAYPDAARQFIALLRGEARTADALYILGDLFEDWVGDDEVDAHRTAIGIELRALGDSGVPCFVMHGNRDFLLGGQFAAQTGCQLLTDPTIVELVGERVLLTHGDALCTDDHSYQKLRVNVRRPAWQRRFLRLSLATRRVVAGAARAGSQKHTQRSVPQIMDAAPAAVAAAMRACGVSKIIHGHTHRPAIHQFVLNGTPATRVVLGAWYEQGSLLRVSAAGYELASLPRVTPPPDAPAMHRAPPQ